MNYLQILLEQQEFVFSKFIRKSFSNANQFQIFADHNNMALFETSASGFRSRPRGIDFPDPAPQTAAVEADARAER